MERTAITVRVFVTKPLAQVWNIWTEPEHITQWNAASPDWHSPSASNDLRPGGNFKFRMEARDGSMGFDFHGTYTKVEPMQHIAYTMGDGRQASIHFSQDEAGNSHITETFEAESENSLELQEMGWQAILNHFKDYAEALS